MYDKKKINKIKTKDKKKGKEKMKEILIWDLHYWIY